jgi:hypothetical protein
MHCPDCGQQQVNEEIRFCSRCGLPLSLISQVVANRGSLPQLAELNRKKTFLSKKTGIFIGITWMLFFIFIVTTFLEIMRAPGELSSMVAVFGIFSGVMMIVGSAFFLPGSAGDGRKDEYADPPLRDLPHRDLNASPQGALPPPRSVPVQNYAPPDQKNRWETNDLAQPSVTEGTTKLLDND